MIIRIFKYFVCFLLFFVVSGCKTETNTTLSISDIIEKEPTFSVVETKTEVFFSKNRTEKICENIEKYLSDFLNIKCINDNDIFLNFEFLLPLFYSNSENLNLNSNKEKNFFRTLPIGLEVVSFPSKKYSLYLVSNSFLVTEYFYLVENLNLNFYPEYVKISIILKNNCLNFSAFIVPNNLFVNEIPMGEGEIIEIPPGVFTKIEIPNYQTLRIFKSLSNRIHLLDIFFKEKEQEIKCQEF